MAESPRLTIGGFLARFALAVLVVGATYNPTPYSYYAWVKSTGYEWSPVSYTHLTLPTILLV